MTPPSTRRNFFLGGTGLPFELPEVPRSLARLRPGVELPTTARNSGLFRQDEALRRLLTLGYPRLAPSAIAAPSNPAEMEAAIQGLWNSARQGNRLGYIDALRATYLLLHHQMGDAAAQGEIPRIARLFSNIAEEYARHIAERSEYSPTQRLTYLFAAARVTRLFLGRLSDTEAGSTAAYAGEIAALRGSLLRFHSRLETYAGEASASEPANEALLGVELQIQMRRAVLEGESDRARSRARELVTFYREHPPLPEDPNNPESQRFYHVAGRELQSDPDFLNLLEELNAPSLAEQQGGVLNGVALQWLATAAGTLDQVNEDGEAAIRLRYQALSAVGTALSLAYPGMSLRSLLAIMRDRQSAPDGMEALRRVMTHAPEIATYLREVAGEESLENLWQRAAQAAAHVETLRDGPGRRVLETVLASNEREHPIVRLAAELARNPDLVSALHLEADAGSATVQRNNALELLRRGEEGIRELRSYAEGHPEASLRNLLRILEPATGTPTPVNEFSESLLGTLQEGLGRQEDHEEAMAQAIFQGIAQGGEVAPGMSLSASVSNHARSLAQRMEGFGYRSERVIRHLVAPQSLTTLAVGILATELTPALLIARAGSSGSLAAPLIGSLVRGGALSARGTFLTGLGTGLGMAAFGTGMHSLHQYRLGLRTHFWRDLGTSSVINGLTFGSTLLFARYWNRLLTPNVGNGIAIGEMGLARSLALHGGNAVFGTGVGMGLGIAARRLQNGRWESSWDEVAENFATMLLWEGGAAGLRGLRRSAGLNAELGLPESGRFARTWNRLPWLRQPTVLGAHRAVRVGEVADRMIQANPSLAAERPFLLRQLGLHEAQAPGSLDSFNAELFQNFEPRLSGTGLSRSLLMVRRTVASPLSPPAPVVAPPPQGNEGAPWQARNRHHAVMHIPAVDPSTLPHAGVGTEGSPVVSAETRTGGERERRHVVVGPLMPDAVDETARTPPRGVPAVSVESMPPTPLAEAVLEAGTPISVVADNTPASTRRGEHFVAVPGIGELAAFTHKGICKFELRGEMPRNEDAYGAVVLQDGSLVALAFDGAGGSGAGDRASARGITTVLSRMSQNGVSLGDAFFQAHQAILADHHGGYTVGTGLRVHGDGSVEVATTGDSELFVARPRGDGSYEVIRPFFPHNFPGTIRAHGHGVGNTLEMNAHPNASRVFSSLGTGNPKLTHELVSTPAGNFHPQDIYNAPLTLPERPDGSGAHRPFQARPGDIFLMMSDGVHELFTREQMSDTMRGLRGAGEIRDAMQQEIEARLEIYRLGRTTGPMTPRVEIPYGRFRGAFTDRSGIVYSDATGDHVIGHVSPDNVVLVALRYDPSVRVPEARAPEASSQDPGASAGSLEAHATSGSEPVVAGDPLAESAVPLREESPNAETLAPVVESDTWAATLSGALLPDVIERVQFGVREYLARAAQGRAHRDSPTAPPQYNRVSVDLAIDPSTGEVVSVEQAIHNVHTLRMRVTAEADQNIIVIDRASIEALQREMEHWGLSAENRQRFSSVLHALSGLDRQAIVPYGADPLSLPLLTATSNVEGGQVLPRVLPSFLQSMRESLLGLLRNTPTGSMTVMATSDDWRGTNSLMEVMVGELTLGPSGEILASNLGRPDAVSPRGTRYRSGVVGGGEPVEVVLLQDGTILHSQPIGELNDRQQAALTAYMNSPENLAGTAQFQETHPDGLDRILGRTLRPAVSPEAEVPAALPLYPENRPTLLTFSMETVRGLDLTNPRSLSFLLREFGQSDLITQVGDMRDATLEIYRGGPPWAYLLTSPSRPLIVHLGYEPVPLVVPRGESRHFEIRPGEHVIVSDFIPGENRLGENSLTFLHHRPVPQE